MRIDVYYGLNLPEKNGKKYKIIIQWGEHQLNTKE